MVNVDLNIVSNSGGEFAGTITILPSDLSSTGHILIDILQILGTYPYDVLSPGYLNYAVRWKPIFHIPHVSAHTTAMIGYPPKYMLGEYTIMWLGAVVESNFINWANQSSKEVYMCSDLALHSTYGSVPPTLPNLTQPFFESQMNTVPTGVGSSIRTAEKMSLFVNKGVIDSSFLTRIYLEGAGQPGIARKSYYSLFG